MENSVYKVCECGGIGDVVVTREVVSGIAGIAACEVEGVDSLSNNITRDNVSKMSGKNLAAGVKTYTLDGGVGITVSLVVKNGFSIPGVSRKVQESVKSAIEGMTGITVKVVDIEIINMKVEK